MIFFTSINAFGVTTSQHENLDNLETSLNKNVECWNSQNNREILAQWSKYKQDTLDMKADKGYFIFHALDTDTSEVIAVITG